MVENGKIVRVVITKPGSGYCTPPTGKVDGFPAAMLEARLGFVFFRFFGGRATALSSARTLATQSSAFCR